LETTEPEMLRIMTVNHSLHLSRRNIRRWGARAGETERISRTAAGYPWATNRDDPLGEIRSAVTFFGHASVELAKA